MKNEQAALTAVRKLNGYQIDGGRNISVEFSNDKEELGLEDCFFYQMTKTCRNGNQCGFLHRPLPNSICVPNIFNKCDGRGKFSCRGKHVSITDLPSPPLKEISRLQKLRAVHSNDSSVADKQQKRVPKPIPKLKELSKCEKSISKFVCLDCQVK